MEWLKDMSLKRTFFLLTFACLLASLILTAVCWMVCDRIGGSIPSGGMSIEFSGTVTQLDQPSPEQVRTLNILRNVQLLSCIFFPVIGLSLAGTVFYHWKLKKPIAVLQEGTQRIRQHDLVFSIPEISKDELGQVCTAFETMRAELLKTNQELWRQAEERKRLNAAFSHDLRNPVTVLKGTVKLLGQGEQDPQAIERLELYTARIERYVEAMSGIQRLEQMPVHTGTVSVQGLCQELKETADLLAPAIHSEIICQGIGAIPQGTGTIPQGIGTIPQDTGTISLDHGLFLTVAENLIGNAARFAREKIQVTLALSEKFLSLTVWDDGPGYPEKLIKDGPKPFGKLEESSEHFGMGLYSSLLLCEKHGGDLKLENNPGAAAAATFQII